MGFFYFKAAASKGSIVISLAPMKKYLKPALVAGFRYLNFTGYKKRDSLFPPGYFL